MRHGVGDSVADESRDEFTRVVNIYCADTHICSAVNSATSAANADDGIVDQTVKSQRRRAVHFVFVNRAPHCKRTCVTQPRDSDDVGGTAMRVGVVI